MEILGLEPACKMAETLNNRTIFYFGPEPWDGLWRNRHQLMSRFAKNNEVWYVEPPALLRQLIRGKKYRTKLCSRDASGVNIFHSPWWLPVIGRAPLKKPSIRVFLFALSLVAKLGKAKPVAWFAKPEMLDYLEAFDASPKIYHIVDEYSGYGNPSAARRQKIEQKEIAVLEKADLAIAVTPTLYAKKSPYNEHTYLVPNAVNFSAYADCPDEPPSDMVDIADPIIGYTGLISARLDLRLLHAAACARPKWNFVFIGAVSENQCGQEMHDLRALDNVHFLGQKSVEATPQYVNQFDVCMIPYALDLRAKHASPLKLYEYAAASKPVVATDFAAARDFEGHIKIAADAESFVSACELCLDPDATATGIAENLRFAADNTWEHRIEQVSEIIRAHS